MDSEYLITYIDKDEKSKFIWISTEEEGWKFIKSNEYYSIVDFIHVTSYEDLLNE